MLRFLLLFSASVITSFVCCHRLVAAGVVLTVAPATAVAVIVVVVRMVA